MTAALAAGVAMSSKPKPKWITSSGVRSPSALQSLGRALLRPGRFSNLSLAAAAWLTHDVMNMT